MNRINLKHLRAFQALAHYQHFSRAAESLGLSQPALSVLIRQLEEDLSVVLLNRTTRAMELTPVGREFLVNANSILIGFETAMQDVTDYALLRRGRLRVAVLPSICATTLPGVIATYRKQHPDIQLSVIDAVGDEILRLLENGQADIGIGHVTPSGSMRSQAVFTDSLVAVTAGADDSSGGRTTWEALASRDIIAMSHGTTIRRMMDEGASRAGVSLRIVLEATQMPVAFAYVQAGLGTAIMPSSGIPEGLANKLGRLTIEGPEVVRPISIIQPAHSYLTPAAASFVRMFKATVAHLPVQSA